jgi:hypothetical protein
LSNDSSQFCDNVLTYRNLLNFKPQKTPIIPYFNVPILNLSLLNYPAAAYFKDLTLIKLQLTTNTKFNSELNSLIFHRPKQQIRKHPNFKNPVTILWIFLVTIYPQQLSIFNSITRKHQKHVTLFLKFPPKIANSSNSILFCLLLWWEKGDKNKAKQII